MSWILYNLEFRTCWGITGDFFSVINVWCRECVAERRLWMCIEFQSESLLSRCVLLWRWDMWPVCVCFRVVPLNLHLKFGCHLLDACTLLVNACFFCPGNVLLLMLKKGRCTKILPLNSDMKLFHLGVVISSQGWKSVNNNHFMVY